MKQISCCTVIDSVTFISNADDSEMVVYICVLPGKATQTSQSS